MNRRPLLTVFAALAAAACGPAGSTSAARTGPLTTTPSPPFPSLSAPVVSSPSPSPAPEIPHVLVIVMENREYTQVVDRATDPLGGADGSAWPRVNALLRGGALATHAYGQSHPSEPNYVTLLTGGTQGIGDDGVHVLDVDALPLQMDRAGIPWRAYMEGMPRPCDLAAVDGGGRYALKHDPFLLLRSVRDGADCGDVVPGDRLAADLDAGTAPPFLFYVPDMCADGHDCSGLGVPDAATAAAVDGVMASSWYRAGGRIVLVWDEGVTNSGCCDGRAGGGHIPLAVLSASGAPGARLDAPLDHAGVLRGLEEEYGLPLLGGAADPANGDLLPLLRG